MLILPNTACLDDAQVAAVDAVRPRRRRPGRQPRHLAVRRVRRRPAKNFALADVFGVDYRGLPDAPAGAKDDLDVNFAKSIGPDYWEKRKNVFDFKQDAASFLNRGRMKTYVGDQPVTFKGPAVRVAVKDAAGEGLGTLRARSARRRAGAARRGDADARQGARRLLRGGVRRGAITSTPIPTSAWSSATRSTGRPPAPPPVVGRGPDVRAFDRDAAVEGRVRAADRPPLQRPEHHGPPRPAGRRRAAPRGGRADPRHPRHVRPRVSIPAASTWSRGARTWRSEATPDGTTVVVPRLDVHAMVVAELEG